ncbi:MAG: protease HtpX [Gammaproteobacteria bacterium]|nr:protease HtpX [Gammaproteobacteria bacterium]
MKRVVLFILTNLAVMLLLGITVRLLGVDRFIAGRNLDLGMLFVFSAVIGFGGAFISLLMSKFMAKWSTGAVVIVHPQTEQEVWLLRTVEQLSKVAHIKVPEVALFSGPPNAFATGATRNSSLVAVSDSLLLHMDRNQVRAVLAHEIAHIANGDMVTMTLLQGVLNTFVVFISRIVAFVIDKALRKDDSDESVGWAYYVTSIVLEITLGVLASLIVAWFSRKREFKADQGSAEYLRDTAPMISALSVLHNLQNNQLPSGGVPETMGITGKQAMSWFASHPPIEERIKYLENLNLKKN